MEVLVLGGTGSMGSALVKLVEKEEWKQAVLYVTTRGNKDSVCESIHYMMGNAKDPDFVNKITNRKYDAIVDFMDYASTEEFNKTIRKLLKSTNHYIFLSSSCVYAGQVELLNETSPRLLDVCDDQEYLVTEEYALRKAREEDFLIKLVKDEAIACNYTILRPYLTYNSNRLQFGSIEKEYWLRYILRGDRAYLPREIRERNTTLTYAGDVANVIKHIINNKAAQNEIINITTSEYLTWGEVQDIYFNVLVSRGYKPEFAMIDSIDHYMNALGNRTQIIYDRLYDRKFDNKKLMEIIGSDYKFTSVKEGLTQCLNCFLDNQSWRASSCKYDAYFDRLSGNIKSIHDYKGLSKRVKYFGFRFVPGIIHAIRG